jgi:hypothetical protein
MFAAKIPSLDYLFIFFRNMGKQYRAFGNFEGRAKGMKNGPELLTIIEPF